MELVVPYLWTKQKAQVEKMHVFFPLSEVEELDAFCLIHFTHLNESCVSFLTCF